VEKVLKREAPSIALVAHFGVAGVENKLFILGHMYSSGTICGAWWALSKLEVVLISAVMCSVSHY
jgi:hypothetical protein